MTNEQKQLIAIIRCAFGNKEISQALPPLSDEEKKKISIYAGRQGMFPFLQYGPGFLEGEWKSLIFKQLAHACYADSVQIAEVKDILDEFEKRGIYCIPLKGIRTKTMYPASELRTMGDLDILYKPEQTKEMKMTMESMGYRCDGEAAKHDHYQKGSIIVEMHKTLLSAQSDAFQYFLGIWERAVPVNGKQFVYEMTLEDHYLFTLYHLIEHFVRGGIGIRMVLDIFVILEQPDLDREYVERELEKLGIAKFERKLRCLAYLWFGEKQERMGEERKEELEELADYIVNGGIFGNQENDRQNNMLMHKSRAAYLCSVVFPSYQTMRTVFPWLKTPVFLPIAWVVRVKNVWMKRRGNVRIQMERAKAWEKKDDRESEMRKRFFERCGL